jgi:hypothetical protein
MKGQNTKSFYVKLLRKALEDVDQIPTRTDSFKCFEHYREWNMRVQNALTGLSGTKLRQEWNTATALMRNPGPEDHGLDYLIAKRDAARAWLASFLEEVDEDGNSRDNVSEIICIQRLRARLGEADVLLKGDYWLWCQSVKNDIENLTDDNELARSWLDTTYLPEDLAGFCDDEQNYYLMKLAGAKGWLRSFLEDYSRKKAPPAPVTADVELAKKTESSPKIRANRVFIGHGRSTAWRELKDFIQDTLKLEWEEFNRDAAAGLATTERIAQMLESAGFAFIVMTAEDKHADGTAHARENVVHEAGLFQGRLGFRKAIILIEEGCEEFSNIKGLTQIRFPKGDILARSEDVRRVLKREGIL